MNDLFDQIEAALNHGLYQLALMGALTLPSICGAMDTPDGKDSGKSYSEWFETYMGPACRIASVALSGVDCYGLRCSMLHQGRTAPHKGAYTRVVFVEPSPVVIHLSVLIDSLAGTSTLILSIVIFCRDMLAGARRWYAKVQGTPLYERHYKEYLHRYPNGTPPFGGIPVIM